MASDSEQNKKPDTSSEYINLKVVDGNNNEVFFKIKRLTQLRKLMDAYCTRQGKDEKTVRFLYDGVRLKPDSTPEEMEMEDGDSIDVMVAQIGGAH
ncbi:MAG: ubiquitin-related domain-containing protein [Piptocephalis tieghemiana]|nr:MAG: ubiquitin-related domain-containing protein [Piptocephalis tieghemiana]